MLKKTVKYSIKHNHLYILHQTILLKPKKLYEYPKYTHWVNLENEFMDFQFTCYV